MRTRTRIRTRAKSLSHGCPWLQFVLETDTLTEVMKEAFQEGKLTAKYVGNAGGSGGLRDGWPSVSDFASMFEAAVRTESVRNLVRAHKEAQSVDELELDAEAMAAVAVAAAVEREAAAVALAAIGDEMAIEPPDDDDDEPPDDDDVEPPDDDDVEPPNDDEAAGPALTLERLMAASKARIDVVAAKEAAVVADLTRRMNIGIRVNPDLAKMYGVAHRTPEEGAQPEVAQGAVEAALPNASVALAHAAAGAPGAHAAAGAPAAHAAVGAPAARAARARAGAAAAAAAPASRTAAGVAPAAPAARAAAEVAGARAAAPARAQSSGSRDNGDDDESSESSVSSESSESSEKSSTTGSGSNSERARKRKAGRPAGPIVVEHDEDAKQIFTVSIPLGGLTVEQEQDSCKAAQRIKAEDFIEYKGRREAKFVGLVTSKHVTGSNHYIICCIDGVMGEQKIDLCAPGAVWSILKSELVPCKALRLTKTNTEPPTKLFISSEPAGQIIGRVTGATHPIYFSIVDGGKITPLTELIGVASHIVYLKAALEVTTDEAMTAETPTTTTQYLHPGDQIAVEHLTGEEGADRLQSPLYIFNALAVPITIHSDLTIQRDFEAAVFLVYREGAKGRGNSREMRILKSSGEPVSQLEPKAAQLQALRLPPPGQEPSSMTPVDQLMFIGLASRAAIVATVGEALVDLNQRAFLASEIGCGDLRAIEMDIYSASRSDDRMQALYCGPDAEGGESWPIGPLTVAMAYSAWSTLKVAFEGTYTTVLSPDATHDLDGQYYASARKITAVIISALAAEGASIAPRHIDDVVRKGAALFAPMYKKKPEKRAATAGTGGTPDVKRGKAPEAERLTRRSVSALPPAPPVTKAGAAAAAKATAAAEAAAAAKAAAAVTAAVEKTTKAAAKLAAATDEAHEQSNVKILTMLAGLTAASQVPSTPSPVQQLSFSPIKQAINSTSANLVSKIEAIEQQLAGDLIEKLRRLTKENRQLSDELAALRVTSGTAEAMLVEKSAQCTRLQASLDNVMTRFLAKF